MAAFLRQEATRIRGSVLQRTQAVVKSPAVAEERRRLVPRRMYSTDEIEKPLRDRIPNLKRHQLYWELIKRFPATKIMKNVAGMSAMLLLVSAASELKDDDKKKQQQQK